MSFIPISRPAIGPEEQAAVAAVLASGQLAQGPQVRAFEEAFAAFVGVPHAVAVASGTAALHLALLAHGLGPGDEVITTAFSFIASANCALFVGARPVFADIEPQAFTLDPAAVEAALTPRTRAILAVHLFGHPCDLTALHALADRHGLVLIEDACQAHGAQWQGRPLGAAATACYSFYATKNMTTGEGGLITTPDAALAERLRLLRAHGSPARYRHASLGYNFRLTDIQAALGLAQLPKLPAWNAARRANAAYLTERLTGLPHVCPPSVHPAAQSVFHQYTLRLVDRDRDAAVETLRAAGIGAGVFYPLPIHQQPLYRGLGYTDRLPITENAARQVLSLPVYPGLTPAHLDHIAQAVRAL
ncbi:MAG: DegT/DnrJ/EryC1/StrS aminotransferase family protein [Anaerolineales bacterium]|nr:DegT/DnrJ/EryC1/StrS aminotransferase family protein [Anaerolineales bacterium]